MVEQTSIALKDAAEKLLAETLKRLERVTAVLEKLPS